ncbi:hypothetical protein CDL15_Pgr006372 [Punica granatum]|uniref:Uncharacterized protein n=1 Tax=Punica granatum TaxID=22663 RepID=A0A218VVS1_PUNGR|nr:hypothetical protein CDL15_Pgr006372 [Punica granatum]
MKTSLFSLFSVLAEACNSSVDAVPSMQNIINFHPSSCSFSFLTGSTPVLGYGFSLGRNSLPQTNTSLSFALTYINLL